MEGIFDEAEKAASEHPDQVQNLTQDAEKFADKETGGKYDSEIDKAGSLLDKEVEQQGQQDQGQQGQQGQGQGQDQGQGQQQ